ncbi:signal peptidase I [Urechidicola sp. KH5]
MTFTEWFIIFLIIQAIHFLGTWKLYIKAGRKAWEAAVPVYNAVVLLKIMNRPWWWTILLFIPIVNLLMFPILWIETIRSFGRNSRPDTILVLLTLGFYIFYVNYATDVTYVENRSLKPRSALGDWVSSIAFAIIAATLVHTYFMRPYTIPTSSLEKTLLIGDYLFVSKFHYGARVPMTPIALPMVHDSMPSIKIPFTGIRTPSFSSHVKSVQSPYMRLPGIQKIKRNEIVVFNWPADTLKTMWGDNSGEYTYKPIDKKTNYVKRCVAIAGDSLQIINGKIFINGKQTVLPDRAKPQYHYTVTTKSAINQRFLDRYNIREGGQISENKFIFTITEEEARRLAKNSVVTAIERKNIPNGSYDRSVFPHSPKYPWSVDNFGPIYIPEEGATVAINEATIPFYGHIIKEYEHLQNVDVTDTSITIDGTPITEYTFSQDYYWMMGDNRHNSLDARSYGYTPFDHVVGKPVFIWMSWENGKPRWERFFTTVHGSGEPVSYLLYFVIALIGYFVWSKFFRKKNPAKN